jgi:hypothetical protein
VRKAAYRAGVEACPNLQRSDTPMKTDTSILAFQHPDEIDDPLTLVLREGARRLLAQVLARSNERDFNATSHEQPNLW